ncbi:hypothetical protein B9G54_01135 [Alloscardovia macacae]|uniref:N-acetyltransferase domain-containing protein n=1 Tax=Alloscardovia macacae TaxID=1160091 RepID=A0A1Y2SYP9_9BIFI|nr:GNAT family protein [Alloscardovia macacae]OTA27430.1 hypothetical protein B9G54_01135 [Alloscardovia macacae]OTA29441.1 hypothetical protein B9T39_03570 [Alloscardovia macacae]
MEPTNRAQEDHTAHKAAQAAHEHLADSITIPDIQGEMVHLRAATWEDYEKMDSISAFSRSLILFGKTAEAERAIIRAWVKRSLAWQEGHRAASQCADAQHVSAHSLDAQERGVLAWSLFVEEEFIGMAFLVDIDTWAGSARIHVILGENYRGRGFTRDAMPRVMTFGFAPRPAGMGLHRIWISVPSANTRSQAVYQSLGFTETGVARDALWDSVENHYMDLHVYDMLVDEYDPIRSLEAFGLHPIMDNPGVREALAQHEHTMELKKRVTDQEQDLTVTVEEIEEDISADVISDESEKLDIDTEDRSAASGPWWRKLGDARKRD